MFTKKDISRFLCCSSEFSAATNSITEAALPPLLFLLLSILLFLSGDPHSHFLLGDVILSGHRIVVVIFLTDGRGRRGGGVCVVNRCWHDVEGDEADEDDHQ